MEPRPSLARPARAAPAAPVPSRPAAPAPRVAPALAATPVLAATLVLLAPPVLGAPPAPARAAPAADVRVARSTTKVLASTDLSGLPAAADLQAVRNEWVAFQAVVRAPAGASLAAVDATMTGLAGPSGATIPASAATLYREHYHRVDLPSWCDVVMNPYCGDHPEYVRTAGDYPDALVPLRDPYGPDPARKVGAPFEVPAGGFAVIFADLHVPADAPPGDYAGALQVTSGDGPLASVPVRLAVREVTLPPARTVATAYGFGTGALPRYHGGPDGGDPGTRARIARNYEVELHRHRIDVQDLNGGVSFEFDGDALRPVDFSAYDALLAPRMDGSFYPDGQPPARFSVGMFEPGRGTGSFTEAQWGAAGRALAEHLHQRGWLDRAYLYSSDEPWMPQHAGAVQRIARDVAAMRQYTDLWRGHVMVTGPWLPELDDAVDIWCPDTAMYSDLFWPGGSWPDAQKYRDLQAAGRELWFYVCNANFPPMLGYDLDSPHGQEPRLAQWGAWQAGATGFLYWRVTYWMDPDPWRVLLNVPGFGEQFARNGDGVLIYPGNHDGTDGPLAGSPPGVDLDGPVVSFRLKQVRDGMEDWELFRVAESLGAGEWTHAQVRRAVRSLGDALDDGWDDGNRPWDLDDAVVAPARDQVALKVQHLLAPDRHPDPEPPPLPEEAPEAAEAVPDGGGPTDGTVAEDPADAGGDGPADAADADAADAMAEASPEVSPEASPDVPAAGDAAGDVPAPPRVSGGCTAGAGAGDRGSPPEALLLVAALAALAAAARRRRHAG